MSRRTAATGLPTVDEHRLLRAALLDDARARDAWSDFRAEHAGVDHLSGDALALLPQLFRNLREVAAADPALGLLGGIYRRSWYGNQTLLHAAAQAVGALQAAGVRAMLVGRGALVALHPGDITRPIEAIDLRVAPRQRSRALACLRGLGWVRQSRSWRRVRLVRGTGEKLNLHLSTAMTDAVTTTVRGVPMLVPSSADQLLETCARSWTPAPLRWIPDAAMIIRSAGAAIDEDGVRSGAEAAGAGGKLDAALSYPAAAFG